MDEQNLTEQQDASVPDPSRDDEPSALLTRLRVIEDQPLETRAGALAQLYEELRAQLESGDAARPHA
jgi:hypothetical protein